MSRFADPEDVITEPIGDCQCGDPPPHARDEAVFHRQLGHGAKGEIHIAGWLGGSGVVFDAMAAQRKLIELDLVSWNLLGPDGKPMPVSARAIAQLDEETVERLSDIANKALERTPVPNESGAPSADSSQESASPNRATRRQRASTAR